LSFCLSSY
ncbi:putative membrane protein, partial [Vibrio parahaemolyticus IDH02640]